MRGLFCCPRRPQRLKAAQVAAERRASAVVVAVRARREIDATPLRRRVFHTSAL
jgi:hypothetical protein